MYDLYGVKCTVDSAFAKREQPFLLKSAQQPPAECDDIQQYRQQMAVYEATTSMRQSAEWGMRAIQSSFPCIKDRFLYEEYGERKIILKMMILLYNLCARKVGINQIRSVYMPDRIHNAKEYLEFNLSIGTNEIE